MIYPEFLREHSTIGICAPSAGVGRKIESFDKSLAVLRSRGYKILETRHVRVNDLRGGTATQRADELISLFRDPSVDAVFCASGGDFLSEILPFIDWDVLAANPKMLLGASDPTGLLYPLTTGSDVATVYGSNAGSFDSVTVDPASGKEVLPEFLENALDLMAGKDVIQKSWPAHLGTAPFLADDGPLVFDAPTEYISDSGPFRCSGRCIGGCIDVLKDLIGTRYDRTSSFLEKYREDGFIWYFDNFSLSSAVLYRTLLQMRYAGWLDTDTTKAVIIGRTLFENIESDMSYREAIFRALPDMHVIAEADIGHTVPHFTMINGAMLDLVWDGRNLSLHFRYK